MTDPWARKIRALYGLAPEGLHNKRQLSRKNKWSYDKLSRMVSRTCFCRVLSPNLRSLQGLAQNTCFSEVTGPQNLSRTEKEVLSSGPQKVTVTTIFVNPPPEGIFNNAKSMDHYLAGVKTLSEHFQRTFERHWSIPFSGVSYLDQSFFHLLVLHFPGVPNSYGPMVLRSSSRKFPSYTAYWSMDGSSGPGSAPGRAPGPKCLFSLGSASAHKHLTPGHPRETKPRQSPDKIVYVSCLFLS